MKALCEISQESINTTVFRMVVDGSVVAARIQCRDATKGTMMARQHAQCTFRQLNISIDEGSIERINNARLSCRIAPSLFSHSVETIPQMTVF